MTALRELLRSQVHQRLRINRCVITAVSLSDTSVPSVDGVCESSHSHTNGKLFIASRHSAKVGQGPDVCDVCREAPRRLMLLRRVF